MKQILFQITSYHQFIVALSYCRNDTIVDVIITNYAVGKTFYDFYDKVKEVNFFNKVYWYDEINYLPPSRKNIIKTFYYNRIGQKKHVKNTLSIDLNSYDDIYVFDDYFTIGAWLVNDNIKYHLLEDTMNSFPLTVKWRKNYDFQPEKYWWMKLALKVGYTHKICGNADCCVEIQVSSLENLPPLKKEKIKIVNRNETIKNLSSQYKPLVLELFDISDDMFYNVNKSVLILTEPFFNDGFFQEEADQIQLYQKLIDSFPLDTKVFIKPHPRDKTNYSKINNAIVLKSNFPIEILQYIENASFDKAVTFSSTAVNTITFVKEKIILGKDKIKDYLNNTKND